MTCRKESWRIDVAALFVLKDGPYAGIPEVSLWDLGRDARNYAGPWPVVAHPPCARWGAYWYGSPSSPQRLKKGDDGDCFTSALSSVRKWGGVIEHPEGSHAWEAHGLLAPPKTGGWRQADLRGGWTCCVEQGHYGHQAPKSTWLYASGVELPRLKWGASGARHRVELQSHRQRELTPLAFRDVLLSIARTATRPREETTHVRMDSVATR